MRQNGKKLVTADPQYYLSHIILIKSTIVELMTSVVNGHNNSYIFNE